MFLSLKEKKISILNALNSISLWFKQAMLYFWKTTWVAMAGLYYLRIEKGNEAEISHTLGRQSIC